MKFIGAFLASVFGGIFSGAVSYFGKKASIAIGIIGLMMAATMIFYVAIKLLIIGVASIITDPILLMYFFVLLPANFDTCMTAIFSAELLAFLYRHKIMLIMSVSGSAV